MIIEEEEKKDLEEGEEIVGDLDMDLEGQEEDDQEVIINIQIIILIIEIIIMKKMKEIIIIMKSVKILV